MRARCDFGIAVALAVSRRSGMGIGSASEPGQRDSLEYSGIAAFRWCRMLQSECMIPTAEYSEHHGKKID